MSDVLTRTIDPLLIPALVNEDRSTPPSLCVRHHWDASDRRCRRRAGAAYPLGFQLMTPGSETLSQIETVIASENR
jgi:hypothetical protein